VVESCVQRVPPVLSATSDFSSMSLNWSRFVNIRGLAVGCSGHVRYLLDLVHRVQTDEARVLAVDFLNVAAKILRPFPYPTLTRPFPGVS
jgi:hypothetical protein